MHNDRLSEELGAPRLGERLRRLELLCDSYGATGLEHLVDLVVLRVRASIDGIIERAAAGDAPFVRLREEGHLEAMESTIDWIRTHQADLRPASGER